MTFDDEYKEGGEEDDDNDHLPPLGDIEDENKEGGGEEEDAEEEGRPNYPGITVDEYGHTFCSAHHSPWCHVCCVSFVDINEEIDENPSYRE